MVNVLSCPLAIRVLGFRNPLSASNVFRVLALSYFVERDKPIRALERDHRIELVRLMCKYRYRYYRVPVISSRYFSNPEIQARVRSAYPVWPSPLLYMRARCSDTWVWYLYRQSVCGDYRYYICDSFAIISAREELTARRRRVTKRDHTPHNTLFSYYCETKAKARPSPPRRNQSSDLGENSVLT